MKKSIRLFALATSAIAAFTLSACTTSNLPTTTVDSTTSTTTTKKQESTSTTTAKKEADETREITRKVALRTYTSFINGRGYGKLEDYEISDLYISVSQVYDYAVFYGYSMEGYYKLSNGDIKYSKYFQETDAEGNVTDYLELLKEAIGSNTFVQVNETIEGYLKKIASLYYGAGNEVYWTYFCFIPEDKQEYQQLYDSTGAAKISGYVQSDLYVSPKSILSYAFYGYTMDQYHDWYKTQGYFTVDGVDYYSKLDTLMGTQVYAQVTDEIKEVLQKISKAFFTDEKYWTCFCSVKTSIIPEGKYETKTTDYYKILEQECGHNQYVQVNDTIKEALKYLSKSFYGDEQYWDYFVFTTPEVAGETVYASATQAADGVVGEAYVSLTALSDNLNTGGQYSLAQYYGWDPSYFQSGENDYYQQLSALIDAYWTAQGKEAEEYTPLTAEMVEVLGNIAVTYYGTSADDYYWFTFKKSSSGYVCLTDSEGEYKTVSYEDSDLYVNLDQVFEYTWVYENGSYTMAQWYSYGGTYAGNFIKTEIVEVTE